MTTWDWKEQICALCGTINRVMVLESTNEMGYRDLDGRPAKMVRSIIDTWVRRCEGCGYCAANLEKASPQASGIVALTSYQEQLHNAEFPILANEFRCRSMIFLEEKLVPLAFWDVLHAAWACDDAEMDTAASKCRAQAIELLLNNEQFGTYMMGIADSDASTALLVDLLRRSGNLRRADAVIRERSHDVKQVIIKDILAFQKELIDQNDCSAHHLGELKRK